MLAYNILGEDCMWEFALLGEQKDKVSFENLKQKMNGTLSCTGGACTLTNENNNVCLLIACPIFLKNEVIKILDNFVVDMVIYCYKKENFEKNLIGLFAEKYHKIIINALVKFDCESDIMQIFKKLEFKNELRLKEFVCFKLKDLTKKWDEVCNITKQNSSFLKSETACKELINFLLKNS